MKSNIKGLGVVENRSKVRLPLYQTRVKAGFPSPADDYIEKRIDLNEILIKHPSATFYVEVDGDSMVDIGIMDGDILIIDRSLEATNGKIVLAVLNNEFTVKRLVRECGILMLKAENENYAPITIGEDDQFEIWGVVTYAIHSL
jgi:DNA polymerase V